MPNDNETMKELLGCTVIEKYLKSYPRICEGRIIQIMRFSFDSGKRSKLIVSDLSTSEKISTLSKFGFFVQHHSFPVGVSIRDVSAYIQRVNADKEIVGVAIQNPVTKLYHNCLKTLCDSKDLDAWCGSRRFSVPVTVEAIYRLLIPFFKRNIRLAIIGSDGYIGSRLYELIRDEFKDIAAIDKGQSLSRISGAQIVISATGCRALISKAHIKHRILLGIDVGISVDPLSFTVFGDFDEGVCCYCDYYSPSPGGLGPLSMAVLVERSYEVCGIEVPHRWSFEELLGENTHDCRFLYDSFNSSRASA